MLDCDIFVILRFLIELAVTGNRFETLIVIASVDLSKDLSKYA